MSNILRRLALGANAPHRKNTAAMATEAMPLPDKIVLLMQQHIGAPSAAQVKKGNHVDVGTLVGKEGGFVGAPIHSGVSGEVTAVEQVRGITGAIVEAVTIACDGQQTVDPSVAPPKVTDRESFLAAVRACGLVGLGGAGFPTAVKLAPPKPEKIDTLIINAAECEPYITADAREMAENGDTVISGIKATMEYLGIPKTIIGIERNKPEETELMFSLTKGEKGIEVLPLPSRYPQGAEKVLIESATGREVPAGGLPADVGVIVMNVTTVSTIGKYLATGMPLVTKRLTVDGDAVIAPKNVQVIIGTLFTDVLEFCGGTKEEPGKLICGGPMMGVAMASLEYPVIKQNNALLAFSSAAASLPAPQPCIRCASCIGACPMGLSPIEITEAYDAGDVELLYKLAADVCIACGTCSFVCPAKRLLSPATTLARDVTAKAIKGGMK